MTQASDLILQTVSLPEMGQHYQLYSIVVKLNNVYTVLSTVSGIARAVVYVAVICPGTVVPLPEKAQAEEANAGEGGRPRGLLGRQSS